MERKRELAVEQEHLEQCIKLIAENIKRYGKSVKNYEKAVRELYRAVQRFESERCQTSLCVHHSGTS